MANGAFRTDIKEELGLGKGYLYCSKNALNDDLALANFGKAIAWVSGGTYVVGDRRTTSSIQYKCIQNATGRTTAMASDTAYWEFDLENFQTYNTAKTYNIGHKTTINNLHYVCAVDGSTGAFQTANWTQVPISNKLVPFRLMNTAIIFLNADTRFVSYELLDTVLNKAYHNIHLLINNGLWNEALTTPTKYMKIIGQSKWKTVLLYPFPMNTGDAYQVVYCFFEKLKINNKNLNPYGNYSIQGGIAFKGCILFADVYGRQSNMNSVYRFCYKTKFIGTIMLFNIFEHLINCSAAQCSFGTVANTNVIKNNYFDSAVTFPSLASVNVGNIDGNYYGGTVSIAGVNQTSIAMIKATAPFQNQSSYKGSAVTLNADYTLQAGSALLNTGLNGNHIGAEGLGFVYNSSNILAVANGAVHRNIMIVGSDYYRQQVNKTALGGGNNYIDLAADASSINDEYVGLRCWLFDGTGVGQTKPCTDYDGSLKRMYFADNWVTNPDSTTKYEILDGEILSAIGDLGASKIIRKINFQTLNNYDVATSTILTQAVSNDYPATIGSSVTYDLKAGLLADLSDGTFRRFLQDADLCIDANGYSSGDALFNPDTIVSNTLTYRYHQILIQLHKIA